MSHSADDGASETTDLASVTDEPHEYRWKKEASAGRGQGAAVDDMRCGPAPPTRGPRGIVRLLAPLIEILPARTAWACRFTFQRRYAKLNWRTISQTSLERIVERIDTRSLEQMLEPLAFARLRLGDVSSVPEEWILKLLRLYQLCLEYLMNVKAHLLQRLSDAAAEASEKGDAAVSLRTRCARLRAELKAAQVLPSPLSCVYTGMHPALLDAPVFSHCSVTRCSAPRPLTRTPRCFASTGTQRASWRLVVVVPGLAPALRLGTNPLPTRTHTHIYSDKNAFGPAAAQFLVHTDSGGGGKGGGSSTRRSGRVSRKPVVVVLDSRSGEREPAEPADYDLLARAKAAEKEVASLQEQLSKSGAFAPGAYPSPP